MNFLAKLYYRATAWIPRKLPTNQDELLHVFEVVIEALHAPDNCQTLMVITNAMKGTVPMKMRRAYSDYAVLARRIPVNEFIEGAYRAAGRQVEAMLAQKMKEVADAQKEAEELAAKNVEPQSQASEITAEAKPPLAVHEATDAVGKRCQDPPVVPG